MKKLTIMTSSPIPALFAEGITLQVSPDAASPFTLTLDVVSEAKAPTLEAYGKVGEAIINPLGDQQTCYAIYLAAIAFGVPDDVAYAAYLVCLAT